MHSIRKITANTLPRAQERKGSDGSNATIQGHPIGQKAAKVILNKKEKQDGKK